MALDIGKRDNLFKEYHETREAMHELDDKICFFEEEIEKKGIPVNDKEKKEFNNLCEKHKEKIKDYIKLRDDIIKLGLTGSTDHI